MFHASAPLSALDALYDIEALRTLESRAAAVLEDAYEPMRRAGQAAWRESLRHWPEAQRLLVVCGHCHWHEPLVELRGGVQVLNVDARAVVLTTA